MTLALVRLVYRSVSLLNHDDVAGLEQTFRTSKTSNKRNQITGCLAQPDGHFVQLIEGRRKQVDDLMVKLRADTRHKDLIVLFDRTIAGRLFADWAMGKPDRRPLADQEFNIINNSDSAAQITGIFSNLMQERSPFYTIS